jgi:hypothetical protein
LDDLSFLGPAIPIRGFQECAPLPANPTKFLKELALSPRLGQTERELPPHLADLLDRYVRILTPSHTATSSGVPTLRGGRFLSLQ